jgi:Domain of unknown function (DUF4136)
MNLKKMGIAFQLAVAGCVILLYGASALAQDVRYNFVAGTDFSKYKTYKWVQIPDAKYPDQILDGQIKQAIDTELSKKGLTKIVEDNADLYVAYQVAINQQTQWNAYGTGLGMGGGWGWGRWGGWGGQMGMGTATATSSTINIGTLNLDLYDVAAKEQVWRGEATKTLKPSKNQQKNLANLQKAMAKLLKNYPPPPAK